MNVPRTRWGRARRRNWLMAAAALTLTAGAVTAAASHAYGAAASARRGHPGPAVTIWTTCSSSCWKTMRPTTSSATRQRRTSRHWPRITGRRPTTSASPTPASPITSPRPAAIPGGSTTTRTGAREPVPPHQYRRRTPGRPYPMGRLHGGHAVTGYLGAQWPATGGALYASKHNPFILYNDIRLDPSRAHTSSPTPPWPPT